MGRVDGSEGDGDYVSEGTSLLVEARKTHVDRVFFEPRHDGYVVTFERGGRVEQVRRYDRALGREVLLRLKIMFCLDIAEERSPQAGCLHAPWEGEPCVMWFQTAFFLHGEGALADLRPGTTHVQAVSWKWDGLDGVAEDPL